MMSSISGMRLLAQRLPASTLNEMGDLPPRALRHSSITSSGVTASVTSEWVCGANQPTSPVNRFLAQPAGFWPLNRKVYARRPK
jgi:hypothetical protein